MIVVDNSVLVAALVGPEALSGAMRQRLSVEQAAAPELIDVEAASTLRTLLRSDKLKEAQAERAVAALAGFPLRRVAHARLLPRVWQLRDALTAYDATYVALAELLGATLVTGDRRLAKAASAHCVVEVIAGQ
ncbi:type II toxin-antitoxin system VapC family toxin [Nocardioides jensenii]|uniref:type II toxin-antitoxin system VapC family toxin n=1 Tax=Nocardioides jensenii TaxID=1843 RepID=UPI00082F8CEB|nr:type II toxin-antitoxin system VapC family toxin [Nocardioides jensenii]